MKIDPLGKPIRVNDTKRVSSKKKTASAGPKGADKVELSDKARGLSTSQANVEIVRNKVDSSPDIRIEKVAEVRTKIKDGFYQSDEFIDKLADKLMRDFGIGQ